MQADDGDDDDDGSIFERKDIPQLRRLIYRKGRKASWGVEYVGQTSNGSALYRQIYKVETDLSLCAQLRGWRIPDQRFSHGKGAMGTRWSSAKASLNNWPAIDLVLDQTFRVLKKKDFTM